MKVVFSLALATLLALSSAPAAAAEFKVLVVMSYEKDNPWVKEISEGIDSVLGSTSQVTYFHLNTKANREGGPKRAEEAHALYQRLQPHGVIAADDDAQAMFVVPFLKDKVRTPVMFNGVNTAPEKYGYPATNVSGVLERAHVRESLSFIKQLVPDIQNACFLTNDVPAGISLQAQVEEEKGSYPARISAFHRVRNVGEIKALSRALCEDCDVLMVDILGGIADAEAKPLDSSDVLKAVKDAYSGPLVGGNRYQIEEGAWAAVIKTGQEQGETAAEMLLQAMRGTPVDKIPMVRNSKGQRVINITATEANGITLRPIILKGATLIKQQP